MPACQQRGNFAVDSLLLSKLTGEPRDLGRIARMAELPPVRRPGLAALCAGYAVGLATSGLLPGSEPLRFGMSFLNAWLTALVLFVALRLREARAAILAPSGAAGR